MYDDWFNKAVVTTNSHYVRFQGNHSVNQILVILAVKVILCASCHPGEQAEAIPALNVRSCAVARGTAELVRVLNKSNRQNSFVRCVQCRETGVEIDTRQRKCSEAVMIRASVGENAVAGTAPDHDGPTEARVDTFNACDGG